MQYILAPLEAVSTASSASMVASVSMRLPGPVAVSFRVLNRTVAPMWFFSSLMAVLSLAVNDRLSAVVCTSMFQ